jgi:hypothetical protein
MTPALGPDDISYLPHDPTGQEWTCMRCGAVIGTDDLLPLHTLWHDSLDTLGPTIEAVASATEFQARTLSKLLGER